MKKMRFVSILASVFCALFLLNACSGGPSGQSGTSGSGSSAGTKTGDPAELTIGFYINSSMPTDMDAVLDEINKILLEKANAKITDKVVLNYGNYLEQITLMLSGNEKLDTFLCRQSSNFMQYVTRASSWKWMTC